MKKYRSHKVVEAAPILTLELGEDGSGKVGINGGNGLIKLIDVPAGFRRPGAQVRPAPGDMLVRYEPDGYLSWSPRTVFEDGYAPEPTTWQERATVELAELNGRIDGLRKALLAGTVTDQHALSLMQRQYKAMDEYAYTLMARLRYLGVIDTETPPTVRDAG